MSDTPCCANAMPLARTVKDIQWLAELLVHAEPSWALTHGGTASEVQTVCNMPPCVYLFAGYARPKGPVAFAYEPAVEIGKEGEVNPFDTGGVFSGRCLPFTGAKDDPVKRQAAIDLIKATKRKLNSWRLDFRDYLQAYFTGDCTLYLTGKPPILSKTPTLGGDDLPARYEGNHQKKDRASWSWEVRIHNEFPIDHHLIAWSCSKDTYMKLTRQLRREDQPIPPRGTGRKLFPKGECIQDNNFTEALNTRMLRWFERSCES